MWLSGGRAKCLAQKDNYFVHVWKKERVCTWWKLHLPEAFDWRRDAVSIRKDVKLLPDAFISSVWHVQDVPWCLPAIENIHD